MRFVDTSRRPPQLSAVSDAFPPDRLLFDPPTHLVPILKDASAADKTSPISPCRYPFKSDSFLVSFGDQIWPWKERALLRLPEMQPNDRCSHMLTV